MRTQFFYTRKEVIAGEPGSNGPVEKLRRDSFNLQHVIRSIEMADGTVLVLLDDIHERTQETPNINPRNNKMNGVTRKRDTYQSEIYLSKEDGLRFYRASGVDEPLYTYVNEIPVEDGIQEVTGETSLSGASRGTQE